MDMVCKKCNALHWKAECSGYDLKEREFLFESCCKKGTVKLEPLSEPPEQLRYFLCSNKPDARRFRSRIRHYNAALSYTSCSYVPDPRLHDWERTHIFQLQGAIYHLQGPLSTALGIRPSYAQLFFLDPVEATQIRLNHNNERSQSTSLDPATLTTLDFLLRRDNPFYKLYHRARDILEQQPGLASLRLTPQLRLISNDGSDPRRYNLPTVNHELAALISDIPSEYGRPGNRDILLYLRHATLATQSQFLTIIHPEHGLYLPLHYVLFYPTGGHGYHQALPLDTTERRRSTRITARMFHRYHLHTRSSPFQSLHRGSLLFQQWVVDAWASAERMDLDFLRRNQSKLRTHQYTSAREAFQNNNNVSPADVGQRVILPSTFTGGDRFMQQLYQDSMAIVRHFGKPALFITFTANPRWVEIERELLHDDKGQPMQTWRDRPDLVARVFHLKAQEFLHEIRQDGIFGEHVASVFTVEYQKRGLPHIHLLLFLAGRAQFDTIKKIDQVIRAEIPDPNEGELYDIVTQHLIHQPCGKHNPNAPCMKERNGIWCCGRDFPKAHIEETLIEENGYPQYRRRADGITLEIPHPTRKAETLRVGNEWVVPYNPYLTWKYQAHINVEVCSTIRAIKYIHKYIYKGSDRATAELELDEIKRYISGRYIGSSEAVWRIFEFPVHGESPSVMHLPIHLPGGHFVSFDCATTVDHIMEQIEEQRTPLIGFFDYNTAHPDERLYLYQDFPTRFTWNRKEKEWKRRVKGKDRPDERPVQIGRIYQVNPFQGEIYYLRRLLTIVPGPTSFDDLRTVNGILYDSFEAACRAHGIISHESDWEDCFNEAKDMRTGWYLRRMLISAILYGGLTDARRIWERFADFICDDLPYHIRVNYLPCDPSIARPDHDLGLYLINKALKVEDRTLEDFYLPHYCNSWELTDGNPQILQELSYDRERLARSAAERESHLNIDQRQSYDTILNQLRTDPTKARFFLHGSGGTGKTYLYSTLCERLRSEGKIVLCVASTGLAALLLPGGRTAHKRFKIPINVTEDSSCFIQRGTQLADLLCNTSLIIWDETPMTNKTVFDAVDRTFRDIRSHLPGGDSPFGGISFILGGDFRQTLPIVRHGDRSASILACLQHAKIWPHLTHLYLHQNMRLAANHDDMNADFASWLIKISSDENLIGDIRLPDYIPQTTSDNTFIQSVYPTAELQKAHLNPDFFIGRAILSARIAQVDELNDLIQQRMHGTIHTLNSIDEADLNVNALGREELSFEYLNSLNHSSLPLSRLQLRIGAPIMLMRNLDPMQGLCNGTRLTVTRIASRCLEVRINGGEFDGQHRLIYRCTLSNSQDFGFTLRRTQFPVRLAFAMTINKSQGQSLRTVGIDLRSPVFAHGQLYVALSRTTDVKRLLILFSPENKDRVTKNIFYPEVLQFL
jgi:PIF1-like helicase/Helitron helicase-like domain at N-terminus/Helicase